MRGHISLPDYQGFAARPEAAPPATLSSKLLIDLLRTELGFAGLIISDATGTMGMTTRVSTAERIVIYAPIALETGFCQKADF